MLQKIKDYLVGLGPDNRLTQVALSLHSRRAGFTIDFTDTNRIWLVRGKHRFTWAKPRTKTTAAVVTAEVFKTL